ncbi:hypothetical protein Lesp02_66140 [Lentzea sp. NBRC 105346]|nr:hypothetical protein Lesp02_66140 [Lentzea sp. NBRC 105346]
MASSSLGTAAAASRRAKISATTVRLASSCDISGRLPNTAAIASGGGAPNGQKAAPLEETEDSKEAGAATIAS